MATNNNLARAHPPFLPMDLEDKPLGNLGRGGFEGIYSRPPADAATKLRSSRANLFFWAAPRESACGRTYRGGCRGILRFPCGGVGVDPKTFTREIPDFVENSGGLGYRRRGSNVLLARFGPRNLTAAETLPPLRNRNAEYPTVVIGFGAPFSGS